MDKLPDTTVAKWILEHCAQFTNDWDNTLYFSIFTMAKEQFQNDGSIDLDLFTTHSNDDIRTHAAAAPGQTQYPQSRNR